VLISLIREGTKFSSLSVAPLFKNRKKVVQAAQNLLPWFQQCVKL